ncbi:beta-galactosidase [Curtobacterium sp. PhB42]|uniref:beta-galactosidase n=1 Tax=unclassified Curtobacterium TaxID=257496 RepID=UPI0010628A59|nr:MULTISPECIES: beta-galactosidase [unclassified Curtobacterium]TDW42406.1 beta-galactosidase [Curtobacterium sp. PhB42]TDW52932.1 beta-galactosidase [Curtobacterium sp. PhB190]
MTAAPTVPWPTDGLSFGGDYSPEQWPREVWFEDVRLMREAGVNLVTIGVFSWALLERSPGEYTFDWLDDVIALLHDNGIAVDLATPTAAPPNWLLTAHPEVLPVDATERRERPGGRLGWCAASTVFREHALRIVGALAERYGHHPAVRLWHVSNELGGGNGRCYCEESAADFRRWLADRYGDVDTANAAWGTAFWGHNYTSFDEVSPPRGVGGAPNPGLFLDFERYSSDALLRHFDAEKAVIEQYSDVPVTTNFMVGAGSQVVDYAAWAKHVAIPANDHYTLVDDPHREQDLALAADRMRGITAGRTPWLLMEHSTGGPSWQQRNRAKEPGEILRNSLAHVARGSDGAMFFQWRASTAGAEQFHSAMVPHAGTRTRIWREVVALGRALRDLAPVQGSRVEPARVAIVVDEPSGWALQSGLKPHRGLRYSRELRAWYAAFHDRQVLTDVVPSDADLDGYDVVVVPTMLIVDDATAARIAAVVDRGATLIVTYLSGVADETARIRAGGYPGAFRQVLGAWSEEFTPLQRDEIRTLDDGGTVTDWAEAVVVDDADVVLRYTDGSLADRAAVTRRAVGGGAWYVSAMLPAQSAQRLVDRVIEERALPRTVTAPPGLEAVRRVHDDGSVFLFLVNHRAADVTVVASGTDLLDGSGHGPETVVPAGRVRVLREERAS